ncbi:MAG: hypothetical protein ABSA54_19475 [Terriglobales bacterium]|jgi:hypothetical protein
MKTKPAITITTTILVSVLAAGLASAQSPSVNSHNPVNRVTNNTTAASNKARGIRQSTPATATHAPAKSSGVVVPALKSQAGASSEHAKRREARKRIWAVPVVGSLQAAPAAAAPENNPSQAAQGNGVSETAEGENAESERPITPNSKNSANGRRDPFISPVVSHAGGSGCNTGKKCLEIGAINLRGVVRAESGFIAVVSNSLNKAYFLRENDPVFNGYVMKITGDSIVFQETLQDRLGKTFTREVVKKITTPAV